MFLDFWIYIFACLSGIVFRRIVYIPLWNSHCVNRNLRCISFRNLRVNTIIQIIQTSRISNFTIVTFERVNCSAQFCKCNWICLPHFAFGVVGLMYIQHFSMLLRSTEAAIKSFQLKELVNCHNYRTALFLLCMLTYTYIHMLYMCI